MCAYPAGPRSSRESRASLQQQQQSSTIEQWEPEALQEMLASLQHQAFK